MAELPPDLERLGDVLTEATTRAVQTRRRSLNVARRLAACLAAGMLVFAATPSHLGPGHDPSAGPLGLARVDSAYGSIRGGPCDPPHGAGGAEGQAAAGCVVESPPPQAR
jgi:hypothetical protein